MSIEKIQQDKNIKRKYSIVIKNIRNTLLVLLISSAPFIKDASAQSDNFLKSMWGKDGEKAKKELLEFERNDALRFEWQKENFYVVDRRDLWRDIIVLYYDEKTGIYWKKKVFKYGKNKHGWDEISKEQFESPGVLKTNYNGGFPNEHILFVDKKNNKLSYKKAKQILDDLRMKENKGKRR